MHLVVMPLEILQSVTVFHNLETFDKYIQSFFKTSSGIHFSSMISASVLLIDIFPLVNIYN